MNNIKCKNCGYTVQKRFCSECGQKDSELLKFSTLVKEFFNEFLDLDSRFFLTLKYLITKPGFLTKEYWKGRKSRYLSPFRIYLISGILLVFFDSIFLNNANENSQSKTPSTEVEKLESDISIVMSSWNTTKDNIDYFFASENQNLNLLFFMPLFSLGLLISNRKQKHLYITHHFVTSLHIFSVGNLLEAMMLFFNKVLPNYQSLSGFIEVGFYVYTVLAIKHVMDMILIKSIIKTTFAFMVSIFASIFAIVTLTMSLSIILNYLQVI